MDGQDYLNQISQSNRPVAKKENKLFSSKLFIFGIGALVLLIITIILGAILSGNKGGEKNLSISLLLHLDNTSDLIEEYQPNVKSSNLRSSSASLYSVLTNTSSSLSAFLEEKYEFNTKDIEENVTEAAELDKEELETELFNAKINGLLDRTYAHKMTYEIAIFLAEESKLLNSTSDASLKSIIETSHDSLENLYDAFDNFSEAD